MNYYEVLVSSPGFHGEEPLTYSYDELLKTGAIITVPLRNKPVLGIVARNVTKPGFTTKSISKLVLTTPVPEQMLQLLTWLHNYYPAPYGLLAQQVLPASLQRSKALPQVKTAVNSTKTVTLPQLTTQQSATTKAISTDAKHTTFLLHGDTGTGKTRVYMELVRQVIAANKSALVLTPEIGLTPQLAASFRQYFANPVVVLHSNLTPAQRRNEWLRILESKEPLIVIGPRSALFSPIKNLGLIVIDEFHDQAYKQEQAPYYHALRIASQLSSLHGAKLVIGSATPLISEYWLAQAKDAPILRLTELPAGEKTDRQITVVNLRDREQFARSPHLSVPLIQAIHTALASKQQSLVFLNRRGTARLVMCQVCGWQALCPRCDLPLTYHGDSHSMRCHTCGYQAPTPSSCPSCKSPDIIFKSIGTKSIVDELQKEFPKARIKRFDTDNVKTERLEAQFADIQAGKVDIMVGTQMLTKGFDLPKLSVVGIVAADTSLYLPDFSAEERTYQLLSQVIGRVGRGHNHGTVIVQTYQPDSPAITAAVKNDWQTFYKQQLEERKTYGFPPFYYLLKLECRRASIANARTASTNLAENLRVSGLKISVIGPSPSFYEKLAGKYQWQLVVKAKDRRELLKVIKDLPSGWSCDLDPTNLL